MATDLPDMPNDAVALQQMLLRTLAQLDAARSELAAKEHELQRVPQSLERRRVVYDLADGERQCPECQGELRHIGEEISEQLEYVPASLHVIQQACQKYACPKGCTVVTAAKPPAPVEKGLAGPGLLAHVAVSKFGDHRMPRTHRQQWRCGTVREMRVGPSEPAIRSRLQTTASCCR